jgi:hypothetical protein
MRTAPACSAAILLAFTACGRRSHAIDVYVAGYESDGTLVAKLWKNGAPQPLSDTANGSIATAVAVDGRDVYVAGCSSLGITVWKNGVAEAISGASEGCAEDITIVNGNVYVVGYESYHPMLWTNGVGQILPHDMSGRADARALVASETDVYVAGWTLVTTRTSPTSTFTTQAATLWKNGEAIVLSNPLWPAIAEGVALDGPDVYVSGFEAVAGFGVAQLWKNGVAQWQTSGEPRSSAVDVAAAGGVVYLAGGASAGFVDAALVWRNGASSPLTDGTSQAFAKAIAVTPTSVFVAGYMDGSAVLWQDGVPTVLSEPLVSADALDVTVVPRP